MSDSIIGARKKKNVRNHLFVVYGVINSVLREGRGSVDIQIYDLVQAFVALCLQECMNDLYDCLPEYQRDRKLALIYQTNINNLVAVNTPLGQTKRVKLTTGGRLLPHGVLSEHRQVRKGVHTKKEIYV